MFLHKCLKQYLPAVAPIPLHKPIRKLSSKQMSRFLRQRTHFGSIFKNAKKAMAFGNGNTILTFITDISLSSLAKKSMYWKLVSIVVEVLKCGDPILEKRATYMA